jgi:imidazolonepropionase-like amidohydrolase
VLRSCVLVAVLLGAAVSAGQTESPGAFAISQARIVPVSGPIIERGTVVVSDGLISAVGAQVQVPPDAWMIDGKGLTVYPGLIDTLTDLGLTTGAAPATGAAGSDGPRPGGGIGGGTGTPATPPSRGPRDRPQSTPWVQAADEIRTDDQRLERWRNAGFTTALTAPKTGIFPGQGAVINLAGERRGDLIVASPATMQVNLQTAGGGFGGGFPGSLMGVVAYVRQVYLDVQHDADARRQYETSPRGVGRPDYDRALRAVAEAQAANRPVLMPATTTVQIARALDLAQELKLRPVLYGVHEGYAAADRFAARKATALVSLKWPEKDTNADPDAEEPLRVLRMRDRAPSTPAAFEKAGVKFAFYSDGAQPQDLLKAARKALDAGLAADAAIKALTLDAADILGVGNRLGSIEPGKIANLVITDGDLFAEKTKVKLVFIDGRKFEAREPVRPTDATTSTAGPAVTMTGKWTLSVTTPQGPQQATADLTMAADGTLSGSFTGTTGVSAITSGLLSGPRFTFTTNVQTRTETIVVTFTGTLEGNSIKGTFSTGQYSGEFSGTRPGGPTASGTSGAALSTPAAR